MLTDDERRARNAARNRARYWSWTPEQRAAYSAKNSEASRRRRERDPDAARERDRANYAANRERILADAAARHAARSDERVAADRLAERERYLRERDTDRYQARKAASYARRPSQAGRTQTDSPAARSVRNERIRAQQEVTDERAVNTYQPWSSADDASVMRDDVTVTEIALLLGRTRAAVVTRRRDLRRQLNPVESKE